MRPLAKVACRDLPRCTDLVLRVKGGVAVGKRSGPAHRPVAPVAANQSPDPTAPMRILDARVTTGGTGWLCWSTGCQTCPSCGSPRTRCPSRATPPPGCGIPARTPSTWPCTRAATSRSCSTPVTVKGGLVVRAELVVAGGQAVPLFAAVEPALDLVTVVPFGIEVGRPAAAGSLAGTVVALVDPFRNDRGDLPAAQRRPVGLRRVRHVGGQRVRALTWPADPTVPAAWAGRMSLSSRSPTYSRDSGVQQASTIM